VRAQCAKIYAKAGVDGRSQLLSVFLEELFAQGMDEGTGGGDDASDRSVQPAA